MEFETGKLLNEINETVNLKLMEFLKKQENSGTQSIINKLPIVQKLREELEQKEEEKKLLYKENQRLQNEVASLKEMLSSEKDNGLNLEIKEISIPTEKVDEKEITLEVNKHAEVEETEEMEEEYGGVTDDSADEFSENEDNDITQWTAKPNVVAKGS